MSYKQSKLFMKCYSQMRSKQDTFEKTPLYKINMGEASEDERNAEHKRVNCILESWIQKGWLESRAANPSDRYFYIYVVI